jgi:pimeloyl-ACP methyl ester carboxylesterase
MVGIESLLSARLFMSPQRVGDRLFFISNLSGRLSLYAMDFGGSVPEPLLPPEIAMQNPVLLLGEPFCVLPEQGQLLVMLDRDGDENYQPMWVPMDGGIPEPAFGESFAQHRVHLVRWDTQRSMAYFHAGSREQPIIEIFQADLQSGETNKIFSSPWASAVIGVNRDHTKAVLLDTFTRGDHAAYLWQQGQADTQLLVGKPLDQRSNGDSTPLNTFGASEFTESDRGLLFYTSLFEDTYGLAHLALEQGAEPQPVSVAGLSHTGTGEFYNYEHGFEHLAENRYLLRYNIDGSSWGYECVFDESVLEMVVSKVLWGEGKLSNGVVQAVHYDEQADGFALAFSTADSPSQIYTIDDGQVESHTRERVLGIPQAWMTRGEDASYESFDGLRVSARLYLPSEALDYQGARPLVYYLHGGPQSQERPDFTWFSMPLIQHLTMRGFAVFVPNARGSTGYGLSYTKLVDRDWGGDDRLDHVHAMGLLAQDPRLDTKRAGVVGRSYGGYMSLILAGRHPELWSAAIDMFGPYDLITFSERIPPTWKPYYKLAIGDPEVEADRERLTEQSPKTHMHQLACPMLVIQGANDPRVVEQESRDLVEELKEQGKDIEILVFGDEGHDVLKFENRVRCYNEITAFFERHLVGDRISER